MAETYLTRESLLWKVKERNDQEAWAEFVNLYRPFVHIILRSLSIPEGECDDIAQEVLVTIWNYIERYEIDGKAKFRTWLITVIRNHSFAHMKKIYSSKDRDKAYSQVSHLFSADGECLSEDHFETHYQKQWEVYLCNLAFGNIKQKFTGKAVKVFSMTLQDADIDDICSSLDIKRETVYRLRSRVKEALLDEIKRLRHQLEG